MEAVDNKYKKWGWGALIGLGAVILIALIVVGVSTKSTPVKTVDGDADSTQTVADNTNENSNNAANNNSNKNDKDEGRDNEEDAKKNANDNNTNNGSNNSNNGSSNNTNNSTNNKPSNGSSAMPKTGPEDDMAALVAWSVITGLGAYYFINSKKNA